MRIGGCKCVFKHPYKKKKNGSAKHYPRTVSIKFVEIQFSTLCTALGRIIKNTFSPSVLWLPGWCGVAQPTWDERTIDTTAAWTRKYTSKKVIWKLATTNCHPKMFAIQSASGVVSLLPAQYKTNSLNTHTSFHICTSNLNWAFSDALHLISLPFDGTISAAKHMCELEYTYMSTYGTSS